MELGISLLRQKMSLKLLLFSHEKERKLLEGVDESDEYRPRMVVKFDECPDKDDPKKLQLAIRSRFARA